MLQVQDPGKWITRQPFSVFDQLLGKLVRCRCSQQLLRPQLFLSLSENKTTPVGDPLNTHDHESLPQVS